MRQREGQEMRLVGLVVLSGAAGREELGFSSQHDGQRGVLAEHTVLGVECAGDACSLPLRGRWRGGGVQGQPEPKVSPPQLRQPQPRGAGLAAGRLRCGHIWGTAAGPGPEWVTWPRQARPGAYKAKTPGRGSGECAGHVHKSVRSYPAV